MMIVTRIFLSMPIFPFWGRNGTQVRKEYSIYPDLLYKPGRKKVLQHFLQMERIFKTQVFYDKYETQSRRNLEKELNQL